MGRLAVLIDYERDHSGEIVGRRRRDPAAVQQAQAELDEAEEIFAEVSAEYGRMESARRLRLQSEAYAADQKRQKRAREDAARARDAHRGIRERIADVLR